MLFQIALQAAPHQDNSECWAQLRAEPSFTATILGLVLNQTTSGIGNLAGRYPRDTTRACGFTNDGFQLYRRINEKTRHMTMGSWRGILGGVHIICIRAFACGQAFKNLIAFTWGMSISVERDCTQVPKALHWIDTPVEEKRQMDGKRAHGFRRQNLLMKAVNVQKKEEQAPIRERLGAGGLHHQRGS